MESVKEYSARKLEENSRIEVRPNVHVCDSAAAGPEVTDPMTPAVEFRNVSFSYDDKRVLNDLSFKLAQGEIKIILSGSGGGKSTILKLILGLLKPDSGQI